ncbi:hypothetical protein GJ744_007140 [Endocarpon pusillum]|uniref:Uncharacterized protein n=1 Tax=Endocarpon pusillum TaxID=364733 RepID=A0A8H7AN63_9EURO|nr:hypothetical protein GJ744_007140 [Endocarpon pusillum]
MMRLRLAMTRDLHHLTKITTTSLIDDPTFQPTTKRKAYPEDSFFWWQLKLERYFKDQKPTVLVIEIDGQDDS